MSSCLVTGGCGFIGSHLAEELERLGHNVTIVDINSTNLPKESSAIKIKIFDFSDEVILKEIEGGKYEFVFHLAAKISVPESVLYPLYTNEENITKSLKLLDACKNGKIKKFIFSSSSAVYGSQTSPTLETCKTSPESPYALQKLTMENYCKLYSTLYGLDTVVLRYFNAFGPRQKSSGSYANLIGSWCYKSINKHPLLVFGDGTQMRDYVFVKDIVQANISSAFATISNGEIYNVGSGETKSVNDILNSFKKLNNYIEVNYLQERLGDVKYTCADINKLKTTFNILSEQNSIKFFENLTLTYEWYKNELGK